MSLHTPLHLYAGKFICDAQNTALADARVDNDPRVAEAISRANRYDYLLAAAEELRHQVEQMRGMFDDKDGAIAAACKSFDELAKVEGR